MTDVSVDTEAGQAVYNRVTLALYDAWVLGFSNRFIWRCPTAWILDLFREHATSNHLDVGVGTGFYPDRAGLPGDRPRLGLMDLNPVSLQVAARRNARFTPETYRRDVLQPIGFDAAPFDSISVNYLLHCLPGTIRDKQAALEHLKPLLAPGGTLFGATLLQGGIPRSAAARRLMAVYNAKGVFSNTGDDLPGLNKVLRSVFPDVEVKLVGCVALFTARS